MLVIKWEKNISLYTYESKVAITLQQYIMEMEMKLS